jgi:hypothetical protein
MNKNVITHHIEDMQKSPEMSGMVVQNAKPHHSLNNKPE